MSQPEPPPVPDWVASTPPWPGPAGGWSPAAQSPAAWSPPAPGLPVSPPPGALPPPRPKGPIALGVVALAGVVAGAVGGAFLVTAVFLGSAEEMGEGIGRGMAESMFGPLPEEDMGWSAGPPLDPSDIEDPVPPVTGPDPVLDAYAQGCFEADYQACDALFFESPPMSDYEEYGATCGGRVKQGDVMSCSDLD